MFIYQIFFFAFAVSFPIIGLVVGVRLVRCGYRAFLASRIEYVVLSAVVAAFLAGLFVAVLVVWFGYAVAHTGKNFSTDLKVMLITGVPSYAASYGLWRLAGYFESEVERLATGETAFTDSKESK